MEQLALHRATLDWLARRLEESSTEERRGLILAAVTRLKILLDHPALVFREPGPLHPARSGKCLRLLELLDAALSSGAKSWCTRSSPASPGSWHRFWNGVWGCLPRSSGAVSTARSAMRPWTPSDA